MQKDIYQKLIETQQTHWWYIARRKISEDFLNNMALPNNPEILEIGCGMGGNLTRLAERGNLHATDYNSAAVEYCKSLGVTENIEQAEFPDSPPFKGKKFDLIILMDVLEHIEEDAQTLKVINGMLKPGGKLFITVPALMSLWTKHDEVCFHKRRYEKAELDMIFQESGFAKQKLSYYNSSLFLPIYIAKKIFKPHESNNTQKIPPRFFNYILEKIFSSERFILRKFNLPIGVSLIGVYNNDS